MRKVKFKTWFAEEVNLYELVEAIARGGSFVTSILKVLYENPEIKNELIKVIEFFEKFYSSKPFEEDKYYLERLKSLKDIVLNVERVEKVENVYIGYKDDKVYANFIEI